MRRAMYHQPIGGQTVPLGDSASLLSEGTAAFPRVKLLVPYLIVLKSIEIKQQVNVDSRPEAVEDTFSF